MDALTFTSQMVGHLAWPASAAFLGSLFRRPITRQIERLRSVRGAGVEATFGQVEILTAEVEAEVRQVESPQSAMEPRDRTEEELLQRFGSLAPRDAVLLAWPFVQLEAVNAARRSGVVPEATDVHETLRRLINAGAIDRRFAESVSTLSQTLANLYLMELVGQEQNRPPPDAEHSELFVRGSAQIVRALRLGRDIGGDETA